MSVSLVLTSEGRVEIVSVDREPAPLSATCGCGSPICEHFFDNDKWSPHRPFADPLRGLA